MTADPRYLRKLTAMRLALRDTLTIGVTGTKGKTSTTEFIAQLMESRGLLTAVSTSDASRIGTRYQEVGGSTWDLIDFALRAKRAGVACIVVELPSIALAAGINHGFDFDMCVLTNIGTDHIPTHGNRRNYLAAKQRMFRDLATLPHTPAPVAVLNADDPESDAFARCLRPEVTLVTYGLTARRVNARRAQRHLQAGHISHDLRGTSFTVLGLPDGPTVCRTALYGAFNVSNVLAALACAVAQPTTSARLAQALRDLRAPSGRFHVVESPSSSQPGVVVDYAHTPESVESALAAARSLAAHHQVHAVFGCGGGIYRRKRPMMGEAAARLADVVTITTDNPRLEAPDVIARDVLRGIAVSQRARVRLEPDRTRAITAAITTAACGDVVAILGRGADRTQAIGGRQRPLSDLRVAHAALDGRGRHTLRTGDVALSAVAAVVFDPLDDVAVFDKRADRVRPTASLVKLMTLLLAFEAIADGRLSLRGTVTLSRYAATTPHPRLNCRVSTELPLRTLLEAVAIRSSNLAATAVAEYVAGSEAAFVTAMNRRARALGLRSTRFATPHGLPHRHQFSTALDMARLMAHLVQQHPVAERMLGRSAFICGGKEYTRRAPLLAGALSIRALKTGFTWEADYNVAVASGVGQRLRTVVALGAATRARSFRDVERLLQADAALRGSR